MFNFRVLRGYPVVIGVLFGSLLLVRLTAQQPAAPDPVAARVDAYVEKQRVVVMTDIANEPDDQMSMVRFLVYGNRFDVEGLIATTSTWMKNKVRPDVIQSLVQAYEQVLPRLLQHEPGFPSGDALQGGRSCPGSQHMAWRPWARTSRVAGAELIVSAADEGGPASAVGARVGRHQHAGAGAAPGEGDEDAGAARRARREAARVLDLGSGRCRARGFGASFRRCITSRCRRRRMAISTTSRRGPASAAIGSTRTRRARTSRRSPTRGSTPTSAARGRSASCIRCPCCIHEGDTPAFLGLINNGLASFMSPTYGGWGGRYVWRTFYGEPRPFWTQGGDSFPGRDNSKDTVTGVDGKTYTSDQATIWRWRTAFQHDFAARMDWTMKESGAGESQPRSRS